MWGAIIFVILFILPVVLIWRYETNKQPKPKKMKSDDFSVIDFFDELRNHIRHVVGNPRIDYAGGSFVRYLMHHHIDNKQQWLGKEIDCHHVEIRFQLFLYGDGRRNIHIDASEHYGTCHWDGKNMHYNYPIGNRVFECDVNDFAETWIKVLEYLYSIDPKAEDMPERVRNGQLSYWTEKAYGHLI
jgi:hypothetical protein